LALPGVIAPTLHASALASIAQLADWQGDYEQAVAVGDASVAMWLTLDNHRSLSEAYLILGNALLQVDVPRAEDAAKACVALYRDDLDDLRVSEAYELLGIAAYIRRDYAQAAAFMSEGLPLARRAGDPEVLGGVLGDLGHVSMIMGRYDQSRRYLREALAIFTELGNDYWTAWCLSSLAGGVVNTNPEQAARLFGAGASLRGRAGVPLRPFVEHTYGPILTNLRQRMGEAALARAWAEGQALALAEALAEAELIMDQRHGAPARGDAGSGAHGLTPREAEILRLVAAGHSNGEIATQLFISVPTVKRHVSTMLGKLQLSSRAAAVAFAHNHGLT
jgi:DNA-binding CsgD family transcriptional regulator/tetratricopeptide (TPR) repeat protein